MKHFLTLIGASLFLNLGIVAQDLKLNDIDSGKFLSKSYSPSTSSADGLYFYKLSDNRTQIGKYDYRTGKLKETLFDVNTAKNNTLKHIQSFLVGPNEKHIIIFDEIEPVYRRSRKAVLYDYDIEKNTIKKLTDSTSKQSEPVFSSDGSKLAYVMNNNIWINNFNNSSNQQVTIDGKKNEIINGATDWVYEEEFGPTHLMEFSPDNSKLAFVKFNERDVDEFSFPKYENQLYPTEFKFKYPKTGRKNSEVSCIVFDIKNNTSEEIKLPSDIEYIPKILFFPKSDDLGIFTLNREQNNFKLYKTNLKKLIPNEILSEKNERYIDSELLAKTKFTDKNIIYLSEKNGYKQIYLLDDNGKELKMLTPSKYDVTALLAFNNKTGDLYYQAAGVSPLNREIYKVNINKGNIQKISAKDGYNNAIFSNEGKYFINYFSDKDTPLVISLNDGRNGQLINIIEDNKALTDTLKQMKLPIKEFTTFMAADNKTKLNGYIIKPADFDANKKYPVVMVQYSGPDSQQVINRYDIGWEYYLAQHGYIVFCIDGRGTGARGEDFRKQTYMNLGILESDDQIAVAHEIAKLPYVNENKIGIWGWSFGGYNTIMSMSRGDRIFKAGVAIAPVTDWKYYDTIYGERFMKTPQENKDGYKNGSPIELVDKLNGNLLIIHGAADDNVHLQNTMEYLKSAIDAGKDVDLFIFPDKDHSIQGVKNRDYLYKKVIKYFDSNL